jgi:histone deacetylase 6
MKSALEGRIQRAEEIANTLKHFKREVALAAEHSKSGRPISEKLLADVEAKGEMLPDCL